MRTATLETKKPETYRIISTIENKKAYTVMTPPEGLMTGDEFEKQVKERVTKFYKKHGLL